MDSVIYVYQDWYLITKNEERDEGAHESPGSGEHGEERTVESNGQPDDEAGHHAVDSEHLTHAEIQLILVQNILIIQLKISYLEVCS